MLLLLVPPMFVHAASTEIKKSARSSSLVAAGKAFVGVKYEIKAENAPRPSTPPNTPVNARLAEHRRRFLETVSESQERRVKLSSRAQQPKR